MQKSNKIPEYPEVLYTGAHRRKLAVIDRDILYEESLNMLSQKQGGEIMRRITSLRLPGNGEVHWIRLIIIQYSFQNVIRNLRAK